MTAFCVSLDEGGIDDGDVAVLRARGSQIAMQSEVMWSVAAVYRVYILFDRGCGGVCT